jgi:hypothetical protein
MLTNTLNTNEIKDSAGTEVQFGRISIGEGRKTVFRHDAESPNKPYRLTISHLETGAGISLRRRSLIRFDKTVASDVDTSKLVTVSGYVVLDAPIGALTTDAEFKNVLANIGSFVYTTGAATTVLFDGTGNGAVTLRGGEL